MNGIMMIHASVSLHRLITRQLTRSQPELAQVTWSTRPTRSRFAPEHRGTPGDRRAPLTARFGLRQQLDQDSRGGWDLTIFPQNPQSTPPNPRIRSTQLSHLSHFKMLSQLSRATVSNCPSLALPWGSPQGPAARRRNLVVADVFRFIALSLRRCGRFPSRQRPCRPGEGLHCSYHLPTR